MANLGKFGALRTKFAGLADFVTIYIAEAHPAERKHFIDNYAIDTHASMEERIEAANTLKEEAGEFLKGCPILVSFIYFYVIAINTILFQVDCMDDQANLAYAALPERLYVIKDGIITFEVG